MSLFIHFLIQISFAAASFGPEMSQLFTNRKLFSGSWELSKETRFNDTAIILSPLNSTTGYGYAWRLRRPSNASWYGLFEFHISNRSALTQIGLYLTKDFGVSGTCFGGPCKFYGIAVLIEISNDSISFEIRKNNGKIDFANSSIIPELTIPLNSSAFYLRIEDIDVNKLIIFANIDGINQMLYMGNTHIDVEKNWISVTSFNNKTSNEISMTLANLSFTDEIYMLEDFDDDNDQENDTYITATEFDKDSNLTNKDFKMISRVITQSKKNIDFKVDIDAVLEGITEFSRVLEKSATIKQTSKMIEELLFPYTDSWKRRSYLIVNETRHLIDELDTHLNNSKESIAIFRRRILSNFNKLNESIIEIENSLYESVKNSSKVVDSLKKREKIAKGTYFVQFISIFSIIEVIITILVVAKIVSSSHY